MKNWRAWMTLALMSALFFIITAATFTSLGPALKTMVGELHWSWGQAGLGFTLLGVFCGITSTIPALIIRRLGVRKTLLIGGLVMAAAFACLAQAQNIMLYFAGCSLAGLAFTLLATVPGTYLLARLFPNPSFAFGLYFTLGGLGGVAGPWLYFQVTEVTHDWRSYWLLAGALVALIAIAAAMLVDAKTVVAVANAGPNSSRDGWSSRAALRTPQFWILAAAYSAFLFCGITASYASVQHLTEHGITEKIAIGMLSLEGLLNAGGRLAGGILAHYVRAKTLLALALGFLIVGLLALGAARDVPMMLVYAAGIGIGYGLTFFASTILLLDYFGRAPNLKLFSIINLIATVGSVAPWLAGLTRDHLGSFTPFFWGLSVLMTLVLAAVVLMRAPVREQY
jgi:OFA family oxalate/formate antiporter-like MFS transporter